MDAEVRGLWTSGAFAQAERLLLQVKRRALREGDDATLTACLRLLMHTYAAQRPVDVVKAEAAADEWERAEPTPYVRLQGALLRFWACDDAAGALAKADLAIESGYATGDESTAYSGLALSGLAALSIGATPKVAEVLQRIASHVAAGRPHVVGDETLLLERAAQAGIETGLVRSLAGTLAPRARDGEYRDRLRALADS
jgi:hypothetical protein